MFKNFNWLKFFIGTIVIFVLLVFIADVVIDKIFHPKEFDWAKIFGFENLFWKVLSSLVGAYFLASGNTNEKQKK